MKHGLSIAAFVVASSVARIARVRWARSGLAAVGLMAALSSPAFAEVFKGVTLFNGINGTINVPASVAPGTVVARAYVIPQNICGMLQCIPGYVNLYQYGGLTLVTGPDVLTPVTGLSARMLINGQPVVSGPTPAFTSPVEIQLVANGTTIQPGSLKALALPTSTPAYFLLTIGSLTSFHITFTSTVNVINGTCTVPDQTVTLPPASSAQFGGVGSTQGTWSFNVNLTNCPPGFNRVGYSLVPVGSETTVAGALPLSADSTATGVRIRVADSSGNPATFNTSIPLTAYSTTTGGSYSVPYQASYVQTGSSVTPGSVSGSMQVLVDYQ